MNFTATCPRGLEDLLRRELEDCGAKQLVETKAAIQFTGDVEVALRVCLWSRIANRVLLPLASFMARDGDELYTAAKAIDWQEHFGLESSFAIDAVLAKGESGHSQYYALRVKDAIVDQFREATGERPNVAMQRPDVRLNLYVANGEATLSLDFAGHSLHQRGYRQQTVAAPLKENVAAALLYRMGWPDIAANGGSFVDPMCGGGTLLIEAAMMAADIAPGMHATDWGFSGWYQHRPALWQSLLQEADERATVGLSKLQPVRGGDQDQRALAAARMNIRAARLDGQVKLKKADASSWQAPGEYGLVLTNPPYGERLERSGALVPVYLALGQNLAENFAGWRVGILTSEELLARATGLRSNKSWLFDNGPISVRLYRFELPLASPVKSGDSGQVNNLQQAPAALVNRLNKNHKHLRRWAKREGVSCFRLYDADLPEYASAIDVYETLAGERYVHLQEYAAPKEIPEAKTQRRLRETLLAVQQVLELPPQRIRIKTRQKQSGKQQYEKLGEQGNALFVNEGFAELIVNLDDYLDTGLFLDHRPTRLRIAAEAKGKRFLNLFCYTGTVSVHAALGGAVMSRSVDLSNTYLDWAAANYERNGIDQEPHRLVRADVMDWLKRMQNQTERYDLIFCDPPSFSNSKRMDDSFDVQRDHAILIDLAMGLLEKGGLLIFSCNRRGFKLDAATQTKFAARNITKQSLPEDFRREPPIHHCWEMQRPN